MNAKFNPVKLVDVKDSKPYTTTLQIAIGLGLQHASVIKLVRTYRPDFADLSPIRFEIRKGKFQILNPEFSFTQLYGLNN